MAKRKQTPDDLQKTSWLNLLDPSPQTASLPHGSSAASHLRLSSASADEAAHSLTTSDHKVLIHNVFMLRGSLTEEAEPSCLLHSCDTVVCCCHLVFYKHAVPPNPTPPPSQTHTQSSF